MHFPRPDYFSSFFSLSISDTICWPGCMPGKGNIIYPGEYQNKPTQSMQDGNCFLEGFPINRDNFFLRFEQCHLYLQISKPINHPFLSNFMNCNLFPDAIVHSTTFDWGLIKQIFSKVFPPWHNISCQIFLVINFLSKHFQVLLYIEGVRRNSLWLED